jgi:hypothetical protein
MCKNAIVAMKSVTFTMVCHARKHDEQPDPQTSAAGAGMTGSIDGL